ncbi:MAG: vitamin K epoxide reductase family protein [Anaerolineales bacterium]|nr:vitamin K epoxide reductase family protein [Anaerolineales bacterium]
MDRIEKSAVILAVLGVLDSVYLTWVKFTGSYATCGPIGNCEAVNSSRYAEIAGVPIALIGILGYLAIIVVVGIEHKVPDWEGGLRLAFFGFTLTGTIYSAYLTYIEIAVLKAVCPYCVISAILMLMLFAISIYRLQELLTSS